MTPGQKERQKRANAIAEKFWGTIPRGEEDDPRHAYARLQARIATRISIRAESGVGVLVRPAGSFLLGELGKQFPLREVTSQSDGRKFEENKTRRFFKRLGE